MPAEWKLVAGGTAHTVPSPPNQLMLKGLLKLMPVKVGLPKAIETGLATELARDEVNSNAAAKQPPAIDDSMLGEAVT